jgi:quercetin dioxygenase-like cupin family protein
MNRVRIGYISIVVAVAVSTVVGIAEVGVAQESAKSELGGGLPAGRAKGNPAAPEGRFYYDEWLKTEGAPVYTGYSVDDARAVAVKPIKRLGVEGAYFNLTGMDGYDDAAELVIQPGQTSKDERHIFEESIYIMEGEGQTEFWQSNTKKQAIQWHKGSMFAIPLNAWHHHTGKGSKPARILSITGAPFVLDMFHNKDFVFNNSFVFSDRYNGAPDYFTRQETGAKWNVGALEITQSNFVPDVVSAKMAYASVKNASFLIADMADGISGMHVSRWPTGAQNAHAHSPGAVIYIVEGTGYSLMWPYSAGPHPYTDGKRNQVVKVPWHEGSVFVPPEMWFHQHFNTGTKPAVYLALTYAGRNYVVRGLGYEKNRAAFIPMKDGGTLISADQQDPLIKKEFEEERAKVEAQGPQAGQ